VEVGYVRRRLQYLIRRADHVLCASLPQRAHWLGWMGASGRLSPQALAADPEASRLIAIVPFGVPETPPRKGSSPLRHAIQAAPDDRIALWAGGLWDWMDPALAVRATAIAQRRVPRLKLALLAGQRPGKAAPPMRAAADEARAAAGPGVHFVDTWVPYEERGAWLLDADIAVSAHKPSLEAELAYRTRLLDCLWTALPAACTAGDVLAMDGEREGWARTSAPGDADGLADAIVALCDPAMNDEARAAAARAARGRTWQRSADTILALLEEPAADRPQLRQTGFEIFRQRGAGAGHAGDADVVQEPARGPRDLRRALAWSGRRDQRHQVQAFSAEIVPQRPRFLQRKVGHDRTAEPG